MAAAIKKKYDASTELIELANGIFNVYVDGNKIWDKHAVDRFPEEQEILELLAKG